MRSIGSRCATRARFSPVTFLFPLIIGLVPTAAAQQLPPVATSKPATAPATQPATTLPAPATAPLRQVVPPPPTTTIAATPEEEKETWLEVTTDRVNLRALSGDTNSVRVGQVNAGTFLWALKKRGNWWAIVPPEGVFSLVEASFVERDGDRGTIKTADAASTVNIRPADMNPGADPLVGYPQTKLNRGDVVNIAGERTAADKVTGEPRTWYAIVPPDGVLVHVSGDYVKEVSESYALEQGAKKIAGRTATPSGGATSAPAAESWLKKLKLAEAAIDAENRKPNDRQDWQSIIDSLGSIASQQEDLHAASAAAQWIDRLNELVEAVAQASTQPSGDRPVTPVINEERSGFDAEGIMKPSVKVPAGEYGLRYGLFRPGTHYVTAYVEFPRELKFSAVDHVGKYVGIQGVKYKEGKVDVYRVTKVTISTVPSTSKP